MYVYITAVGIRCADHVTPLYPQKLALTSPTGGGRSVGIVHSRTKSTEFLQDRVYLLLHFLTNVGFMVPQTGRNLLSFIKK